MDILKRIDHAQQFCKFYADGAYSVEKEKWNYHVTPEFIEDIRQYIESLQLKLMHLQKQQAEPVAWRYHPVNPFKDKEGMHKVSDAWRLIDKPNHRDAHSAMCGMEAEPLYTAPPQRKPLDEWVIDRLANNIRTADPVTWWRQLARDVENAHNIKEKP